MQTVSPETPTTTMSDGDLLRAYVESKDQKAFALLIERHASMVRGVCRRILGSDSHADDLLQAVSLLLFRKANELTGRSDIAGWVHNVARYCAFNIRSRQFRHERLTRDVQQDQATAVASPSSQPSPWNDAHDELDQALSEIPERYRIALVLHYFEGLPYEEVARRIGSPQASVRTLMQRGRERLRKKLGNRRVVLSMVALVAGLESEAKELPLVACRLPIGESPELPEEIRAMADTVMVEMDRAAATTMWRKIGWMVAGVATIGLGTALVVSHLQSAPIAVTRVTTVTPVATAAWRIESVSGAAMVRRGAATLAVKTGDVLCLGDAILTSSGQEVRAVSEMGDRVLLREEGELKLGTVEEGRAWASSPRRSAADLPLHLVRGAVVAQIKHPTCLETQHAKMNTDGAELFLMLASGVTTNDAPWSFTRMDVVNGAVKFRTSSISDPNAEIELGVFQFVVAGSLYDGVAFATMSGKSVGREMSPKYGGCFFREYAEFYSRERKAVGETKSSNTGRVLKEWNPRTLAEQAILKEMQSPDIVESNGRMAARFRPVDGTSTGSVTFSLDQSVLHYVLELDLNMEQNLRNGSTSWFSVFLPTTITFTPPGVSFVMPWRFKSHFGIEPGKWQNLRVSRLPVGQHPQGVILTESVMVGNNRTIEREWGCDNQRELDVKVVNMVLNVAEARLIALE